MKSVFKYILIAILIAVKSTSSISQTLDQSQLIYNGGMSARTLAGYSEWQSFTAGLTGTLCQINMGFFNYINGSGTLKIFSGTGTGGTLRQSKSVSVYCASGSCMISFSVSVAVTAGQVYTFQFIPGAGIPDPYGVQVQVPGTYGGGQMAIIDPSGTYPLTFDMVFQTFVITGSLPVELISFTGEIINNVNHLTWATASETNNDYFEVERSVDGITFEKIGNVDGNGNSKQILNYKFDDTQPVEGINYYRLKQIDFNGQLAQSQVIGLKANQSQEEVSVYPNPAYQELNCCFSLDVDATINIFLCNAIGKIVMQQSIKGVNGMNYLKINISNLSQGVYFLEIENAYNHKQTKFVKM